MSIASLANKTCTIGRATSSKDNWGGEDRSTYPTVAVLSGRVSPVSGNEGIIAGKPEMVITHKISFDGTPDIRSGDRITVGSKNYYVQAILDHSSPGTGLVMRKVLAEQRDA
jgi:head-tail adaptor